MYLCISISTFPHFSSHLSLINQRQPQANEASEEGGSSSSSNNSGSGDEEEAVENSAPLVIEDADLELHLDQPATHSTPNTAPAVGSAVVVLHSAHNDATHQRAGGASRERQEVGVRVGVDEGVVGEENEEEEANSQAVHVQTLTAKAHLFANLRHVLVLYFLAIACVSIFSLLVPWYVACGVCFL
jgi:hypothetical protein